MPKWARARDVNEAAIVSALRAAGASVTSLSATGVPDLLVGFRGQTFLIEVKQETATGKALRRGTGTDESGLYKSQQAWWSAWKGAPPVIVTNPEQALRAIGALPGEP